MTRVQILLGGLVAILVVVLFWLLLWAPQQDELASVRDDIEQAQNDQQRLTLERDELRAVRDEAPNVEARLVAAESVIPGDPALPSALRQLQQAADDSGTTLRSISPARPTQVEDAQEGLSRIDVALEVEGSYFQFVDFLRRIEDPALTPRGLIWRQLSLERDEHPELNAVLTGTMYAQLPAAPPEEPEEEDAEDADVEVEIEEDAE